MNRQIAIALGGGGARGALEVGALRALYEHGLNPTIITGTSIGALNAISIALYGWNKASLDRLESIWLDVTDQQMMDPHYQNLIVRAMLGRPDTSTQQRIIEFLKDYGLSEDLTFEAFLPLRLGLVSTDLTSSNPIVYGLDPKENVLEGVLASIALQPWFMPLKVDEKNLIDGGLVSNVPVQVAMEMGADEIFALDLNDLEPSKPGSSLSQYLFAISRTVTKRITDLEIALAESKGIPVHYLPLVGSEVPTWEFSHSPALIGMGYSQANNKINEWAASRLDFLDGCKSS